jgi:riboflavin synthase
MFTGLVEALGRVRHRPTQQLSVYAPTNGRTFEIGESVAINGCCLTVTDLSEGALSFDLSEETLRRTNLSDLDEGDVVNVERAMLAEGRFGGHLVQGHVDSVGALIQREPSAGGDVFTFQVPRSVSRYLIEKGSVALDGISLTVVGLTEDTFQVWVIPHTLANTNLSTRKPGDRVNVEIDLIAKYVEKLALGRA